MMKVSEVSVDDGKKCAQLINLLKAGKWELSGPDITAHAETVRWVNHLAIEMAKVLEPEKFKAQPAPPSDGTGPMKVKSMGSLPSPMKHAPPSRKKGKK